MQIFAFQGFRYAGRAGSPGELAAPPFDQIDDRLRDELHSRSSYHFSRFTRPVPRGSDSPYEAAAFVHAKWIEDGAVLREREPALYPYVIDGADGERRLGVCCCVDVGTPEQSMLRPHEQTVEKPLEDRLALLRETRIDPEPVMLLADDDGRLEALLQDDLRTSSAKVGQEVDGLVSHLDADGNRHTVYGIHDAQRIEDYKEAVAGRIAFIADGHHRTKTAQLYAREVGAREGSAAATKMAVLFSVRSRALRIDPVHRLIVRPVARMGDLEGLARSREAFTGRRGGELAARVAEAEMPALGVWIRERRPELWRLDPDSAPPQTPERSRRLPVVLLHAMLLPAAGLGPRATVDGTLAYVDDPEEAFDRMDRGEAEAGFWLPPMSPETFAEAVSEGDLLPPKSTRFLPKLTSGLVWVGHDAELL